MGEPIKMPPAGIMDQAALYLQIKEWMALENKVSELTRMVGDAEQARAAAEVRAEAAIHAEQVVRGELGAVQTRLQALESTPPPAPAVIQEAPKGLDPALTAILARIESGVTAKPAPAPVLPPSAPEKPPAYDVIVHRDELGTMRRLEITQKADQ